MVDFNKSNDEPDSIGSDAFGIIFQSLIELGPKLAMKWGLEEGDPEIARAIGEADISVGTGFCVVGVEHTTDELNSLTDHAIHMIDGFVLKRACDDETDASNN